MTLAYSTICKDCWQQKHMPIPLRGVLSVPFRAVGIRPSRMNPNICTICELMFERTMKARTVVNTAARTQSAAEAGQILVTEDVCRSVGADLAGVESREYRLKGFDDPIRLYAA
jgi:hypothetical protein